MADPRPPAPGSVRPTVLVVGDDEPMDEAICAALDQNGLDVERVPTLEAVEATRIAAPDLVLLVGDAARAAGETVLARLAQNSLTQLVPVALLSDDTALGERLAAFRHGAVAVVPRSASVDEMARKVADVAREMPERRGEQSGELGEATLDELMKLVKQELRSGILSVEAGSPGNTDGSTSFRLVLGAGKPVAKAVEAFVAQLRPLVSKAEPLRYELLEHAGARFGLLDSETGGATAGDADLAALRGLRVLLVVLDPVRADALSSELRACGAVVAVADASGRGLERARGLDPEVVIIDAAGIEGPGFAVVKACRQDPRLRWASMLVAHWEELWPEGAPNPDMARLASRLAPLIEPDRTTAARARTETSFDTRLELIGPSRLLRALARVEPTLHIIVRNPRCVVDVDLSQGLVVGAIAKRQGGAAGAPPLDGLPALAALLALGSGRVRIERRTNPQSANVMAPVEEALAMAAGEEPPLPPSVPPPSLVGGLGGQAAAEVALPNPGKSDVVAAVAVPPSAAIPEAPTPSPTNTFDEAPTANHPHALPAAGKRTLVGLPSAVARAGPVAKPAIAAKAPPRPKTMLGLAPALVEAPVVEPEPVADAPLPLPARVPLEASIAAASSPVQTLAPGRRTPGQTPAEPPPRAPAKPHSPTLMGIPEGAASHLSPALSGTQPSPVAPTMASTMPGALSTSLSPEPLANLFVTGEASEAPPPPLADDSFVIPESSVILKALPPARAARPARRPSKAPLFLVGAVAIVLFAVAAVAAALVLPRLLASTSSPGTVSSPPVSAAPPPQPVLAPAALDAGALALAFVPPMPVLDAGAPPPFVPAPIVHERVEALPEPPSAVPEGTPPEVGPDTDVSEGDRLVVRANRVLAAGDMREAEVIYLRAIAIEPHNPHALAGLARLHIARRAGRQALTYAEQAVAVRPRRAAYRVVLGDALVLLGRRGDAQRAYREALQMDPHNREARARLPGSR